MKEITTDDMNNAEVNDKFSIIKQIINGEAKYKKDTDKWQQVPTPRGDELPW